MYLIIPCSVLGLGALFGGVVIQSVVLDFNVVFEVIGVLKLVPSLCVAVGALGLATYLFLLKLSLNQTKLIISPRCSVIKDRMAKMWFLPMLRRDSFRGLVLDVRRDVKEIIEDGYLEYSLGRDGVWNNRNLISSFYIGGQFDRIGACFIKGFIFLGVFLISYFMLSLYNR